MTNDFDDVYWMLDTGFRPMVADSHQYYIYLYNHQCLCVTKLGQTDPKDHVNDQYRCSLSKSTRTTDKVCSDPYHINSLKDWITATGVTPKQAVLASINLALTDPSIKNHSDLKKLKLNFNPIVRFIEALARRLLPSGERGSADLLSDWLLVIITLYVL